MGTFFVKGYGFHEIGTKDSFNIIIDVENVNAENF